MNDKLSAGLLGLVALLIGGVIAQSWKTDDDQDARMERIDARMAELQTRMDGQVADLRQFVNSKRADLRDRVATVEQRINSQENTDVRHEEIIKYFHLWPPSGREQLPPTILRRSK